MMNILVRYHFGTYRNFKEYYPDCVLGWMSRGFPDAVSYNRFAEFMPRVFIDMLLFMRPYAFGKCTGITFVDSAMIPVCHNVRRYFNKVFASLAKNGKGTMGWCHGFKLHLMCNDRGDIITFCLTGTNVDDRDTRVWEVFTMELYGRCSPTGDTHQERTLRGPFRLRHPPRAWTEGQHEEQDHAHVGQDHAPQEMLRIT